MLSTKGPVPIMFLITGLGVGGAETQLVRLVLNLDRKQWMPRVVSMTSPEAFEEQLQAGGVSVLSLGMQKGRPSLVSLWKMMCVLRQERPTMLVCFMFHANLMGRLAGSLSRVPVIVSSVRSQNFGPRWRERALMLTDWLGEITVTNSRTVADSLIARGVAPRRRLCVIPNALCEDAGKPPVIDRHAFRRTLGLEPNHFAWLAVGRLEEAKAYPTLLKAFATVAVERPQARLLIAGAGSQLSVLQNSCMDLKLEDRVQFLGKRGDVPSLLAVADSYVLSSAWEGVPNGLLEAMAAATPPVTTAVGGTPELVENGRTGFIVPPGEPALLADAMQKMMGLDDSTRLAMGNAARQFVCTRFDGKLVASQWEALFKELVDKHL